MMMIRNVNADNAAHQHIRILKNEVVTAKKISFAITGMIYILKYIKKKVIWNCNYNSQYCCFYVSIMCIYSINTSYDASLKSSYFQKSSLCKRGLGKSFVLFHAELFLQRQRESMSG